MKVDGLTEGQVFWQVRYGGKDYGSLIDGPPQPLRLLGKDERMPRTVEEYHKRAADRERLGFRDDADLVGEVVGHAIASTIRFMHGIE